MENSSAYFLEIKALFPRITRILWKNNTQKKSPTGLNANQISTILFLKKTSGTSMGDIKKHTYLTKGAVSSMISLFEKEQLVIRCHSTEDRRSVFVKLTEKGIVLRNQLRKCGQSEFNLLFLGLSEEDQETFQASLSQISLIIDKMEIINEK